MGGREVRVGGRGEQNRRRVGELARKNRQLMKAYSFWRPKSLTLLDRQTGVLQGMCNSLMIITRLCATNQTT